MAYFELFYDNFKYFIIVSIFLSPSEIKFFLRKNSSVTFEFCTIKYDEVRYDTNLTKIREDHCINGYIHL